MLKRIQGGCSEQWEFGRPGRLLPRNTPPPERNPMCLYRVKDGEPEPTRELETTMKAFQKGDQRDKVVVEDWGLVVRAPHPQHIDRFVMIMAGGHSLGTKNRSHKTGSKQLRPLETSTRQKWRVFISNSCRPAASFQREDINRPATEELWAILIVYRSMPTMEHAWIFNENKNPVDHSSLSVSPWSKSKCLAPRYN